MSYSFLFKYIIIGDSGVGKSCLLLQYTDQRYRHKHEVTIGVEFGARVIQANNNNIKLQIWDTAGQESFKAITRAYYKNAIGAIVCYDISSKESFDHVARWIDEAKSNGPSFFNFVLVGNKSDKNSERKIQFEQGLRFAKERGIPFLETSAKNGDNVEEIFNILTNTILTKLETNFSEIQGHPGLKVGNEKYIPTKQDCDVKLQAQNNVSIEGSKKKKQGCCR